MLTPQQRVLRARIAAHALHASHDPRESTANARAAFLDRFLDEVDPNRTLPEAERQRRARHARSRYFAKLAFAASKARRKRRGRRQIEVEAPAEAIGGASKEVRDVEPIAAAS